jgi:hypothetical protein
MPSPYHTTIDISDEALEMFHTWTGFNTHADSNSNTKFQMRDFHIDLGMAVLGYAVMCDWTVRTRKFEFKGTVNILYELRGFTTPKDVPLYRQNCSEEIALFLHHRLIRSVDFLRTCSRFSGIPHLHVICSQNFYVMSAIWRPYQNKLWMFPVDEVQPEMLANQ